MRIKPRSGTAQAAKQAATPVGVDFAGNVEGGLPHMPLGMKRLKALRKQAKGGVRFKAYDEDGVRFEISVSTNTNMLRIITDTSVYLDSGFYNHKTSAYRNVLAFVPSQLLYASAQADGTVQGRLTVKDGRATGQTLPAGRNSKPMGAAKPLINTSPNGFTSTTADFADDETLFRRKRVQTILKPSNWQGLTRLFVQCLYGSTRGQTQYDILEMADDGTLLDLQPPLLSLAYTTADNKKDWLSFPHTGIQAPWVMLERDKRQYWLVTVNANGTASFRKLATPIPSVALNGNYTPLQARQLHAVYLAGVKLTDTVRIVPLGIAPVGDTLGYGWAADANGHTAKLVGHALTEDGRIARSYTAAVQFDDTGKPNGLTLTLNEEAEWDINSTSHCLYQPFTLLGQQYEQAQPNVNFFGGKDCDAPLLARSVGPDYTPEIVRIQGAATEGPVGFSGAGIDETGEIMDYGTSTVWVVTASDLIEVPPESYDEFGPYWNWASYLTAVNTLQIKTDTRTYTGWGYPSRISGEWGQNWEGHYQFLADAVETDRPLLMVPFDDAESVVSGLETEFSYSRKTTYFQAGFFPVRFTFWRAEGDGWVDNGEVILNDADTVGTHDHINTGQLVFLDKQDYVNIQPGTEVEHSVRVHQQAKVHPVTDPSNVYFHPEIGPAGNPLLNPAYVEGCMGDSYQYDLPQGESDSSDWPVGGANAVGWV